MYAPDPIFIHRDFSPSEYDIKLLRSVRKYSKQTGMVTSARITAKFGVRAVEELDTLYNHDYLKKSDGFWSLTNRGLICLDNADIIRKKVIWGYIAGVITGVLTETIVLLISGLLQI